MLKRKRGLVLIVLGILLVGGAACLEAYNRWEDNAAFEQSVRVKESMTSIIPGYSVHRMEGEAEAIPDYVLNPDMEMPVIAVDGRYYIGTIVVPELEIDLPVRSSWDYIKLKSSPCLYTGSIYKRNAIIMAHNYRSHFKALWDAEVGMKVYFTDADENEFIYTISKVETLDTYALEELNAGQEEWDLTLFTCTYGGNSRVTVRCTLDNPW